MNLQRSKMSALKYDTMVEEVQTLVKRESMYTIHPNGENLVDSRYRGRSSPRNTMSISPCNAVVSSMRDKICQWMYRVVDHCNYDRKVTFIA